MPELLTLQDLANGHLDVKALGEAANGDENTIVTTRTGNTYPSAERAINIMFQNGGLPAKPFPTLAKMQTDGASMAEGQLAQVYNETTNNGLYVKKTGDWVKATYDPLSQAKNYVDANLLFTPKNISTEDLNTLIVSGYYTQAATANATALRNYPASAVSSTGAGVVFSMSANTKMQIWLAKGLVNTRMTFTGGTTWTAWDSSLGINDYNALVALIDNAKKNITSRLEWFLSGVGGAIAYDKSTKTLSWATPLIASKDIATKRINIAAGSVTFTGTGYEVLYLDLDLLPTNGTVTTELLPTVLKISSYNEANAVAFTDKINQLPLAKLNQQGVCEPCAGFVPINNGGAQTSGAKDTFKYDKIADRISIYLPATNGNLIKYLFRHDVKAFDGTSGQSQLDMWRIERAMESNQALVDGQEIVTYGEWVYTMRETAYPADHVGGVHGDEVLTNAAFIVDGVYKDPATWSGSGDAKEIQLLIKSVIYRLNTQTPLANHYLHYRITKDGIKLHQNIELLLTTNLDRLWLAMLPMVRLSGAVQVSKRDIRDAVVRDVSTTAFDKTYTPLGKSASINLSGDKYSADVIVSNVDNALSTADVYVSNDAAYNKIYVSAIGGASSGVDMIAGHKISWDTEFKINAV